MDSSSIVPNNQKREEQEAFIENSDNDPAKSLIQELRIKLNLSEDHSYIEVLQAANNTLKILEEKTIGQLRTDHPLSIGFNQIRKDPTLIILSYLDDLIETQEKESYSTIRLLSWSITFLTKNSVIASSPKLVNRISYWMTILSSEDIEVKAQIPKIAKELKRLLEQGRTQKKDKI